MTGAQTDTELPDARDRAIAVGTFDHNLVVTAGAGTGKTTLLVDRLAHLILRNPDPLKITDIVALTFTNKAADEMKLRLRQRLQDYMAIELDRPPATEAEEKTKKDVETLIARYRLSKDELDSRAHDGLRNLERADIGTIHSFAATLLRLYPLEAGVDPQFQEDDGKLFERHFDEQWDLWLGQELALTSAHAEHWRMVLRRLKLDQVKALAESLCAETVELDRGEQESAAMPEALQHWLDNLAARTASLIERHPENRQNEKLLHAAHAVIEARSGAGRVAENGLIEERNLLAEKSISAKLKGWSDEDVAQAQEIVRAARGLGQVDEQITRLLRRLLTPFAGQFRRFFTHQGFVSFDGLLIGARNLVRDHPRVREELKRRYRAILIDEFQDTDPIQYEILLYLAEGFGESANNWRAVRLIPGKVFVVGDPKQSIYAFRRADIEAYLEVVEKIIKAQNGVECLLTTNFRSEAAILKAVNGVFKTLIQAQAGVQPPYIAIHPAPGRIGAPSPVPKLLVRKIVAAADELDAEMARRLEGESLARWLKNSVLGKASINGARDKNSLAQPKDVAILFRKLTDIHDYLEPFRRHGIRYVVEGERHFYAAKEIIDAVNLLRAVDNPHDRVALAGVLRSPLGGVPDQKIYELHRRNLLDYRVGSKLDATTFPRTLAQLYNALARLHDETRTMSVGAALGHLFAALPVEALAACYYFGEQAVANLEKLLQQAERLGREGLTTLKEAIRLLERSVLDVKEEGESVLAEENLDAVRIMSIHKAKGLEFPIVVLAGCQTGTEGRRSADGEALFDWSTGLTGMRIGAISDLAGLYIAEKTRLRDSEEQKRLLYVAMTRARQNLIISCAPGSRRSSGSFFSMLDDSLENGISGADVSKRFSLGDAALDIEVIGETLSAPSRSKGKSRRPRKKTHWQPFVDIWARRGEAYLQADRSTPFLTPTLLKREELTSTEAGSAAHIRAQPQTPALVVGNLAHRFLQNRDLTASCDEFADQLRQFIDFALPKEFETARAAIESELLEIFRIFFNSKAYAELSSARILGREVPLLMPWDGKIMEGVIDLIYEKDGLLYVADYKTDRIVASELHEAAARYRQQAEIYSLAARQGLRREVAGFKLIFLRLGEAVQVPVSRDQGALFYQEPK